MQRATLIITKELGLNHTKRKEHIHTMNKRHEEPYDPDLILDNTVEEKSIELIEMRNNLNKMLLIIQNQNRLTCLSKKQLKNKKVVQTSSLLPQ